MKILLVNASFNIKAGVVGDNAMIQPLGVAYLASYLRSLKYSVEIYEPTLYGGSNEEHFERIKNFDCDVIGFSQCADGYKDVVLHMITKLRDSGYKGFIIVGGHSPSLNSYAYLNECSGIDCIIVGEGEVTLAELLNCLLYCLDWHIVDGLVYREKDSGKIITTAPRALIQDIDTIPFPARDILESRISITGNKSVAYLLSSRGCYQNCSFCSVATYYNMQCGNRFRFRSISNIVAEIKEIHNLYGVTKFSFIDDNFILPGSKGVKRCNEFYILIKALPFDITFEINTRIDTVERKSIELLKGVGLKNICIGIESFLESDLKIYNKNITLFQIEHTLLKLFEAGYSTEVGSEYRIRTYMIVFNPYTTLEGLKAHLVYLRRYHISPKKMITILTVFDHTDIKTRLINDDLLYGKNAWYFKDNRIGYIYESLVKYVKCIMNVREKVRNVQKYIEKYVEEGNYQLDESLLDKVRKNIDISCYDFLEKLIQIVEEQSGQSTFNFEYIYTSEINKINSYIMKMLNGNVLNEFEEKYKINLDCFIYDNL